MDKSQPPPYNPYPEGQSDPYQQQPYMQQPQPYPQPQPYAQPYPQPQQYQQPNQSYPTTVHVAVPAPQTHTVVVTPAMLTTGNCPGCRRGNLSFDFTCCGICCAIIFFPIGILCCFLMAEKRCNNCRGVF